MYNAVNEMAINRSVSVILSINRTIMGLISIYYRVILVSLDKQCCIE